MAGLKNIQVTAALIFDDGNVVTFSTPLYNKDIRDGDYFTQNQTQELLALAGAKFAEIVEEESLKKLHHMALIANKTNTNNNTRKPKSTDDFSVN